MHEKNSHNKQEATQFINKIGIKQEIKKQKNKGNKQNQETTKIKSKKQRGKKDTTDKKEQHNN